jgi:type VI secretion system protein ImpK
VYLAMTTATLDSPPRATAPSTQPAGLLALTLQEAFTVTIRLRANRQVATDADSFRIHIKQLLASADHEARRLGYSGEYVRLAVYAYIAFLDESILNSQQAMFAAWPRQPLQEEVFGDHIAGETFFRHLEDLLSQQDSPELADVLEVFQLCMLLGFRGRYAMGDPSGLQSRITAVQQKILRIRGGFGELGPAWALPENEQVAPARDPWVPRLGIFAGLSFATSLVLYITYRILLASDIAALQAITASLVP